MGRRFSAQDGLGLLEAHAHQYDFETGLYYVNARYYDSTTGRFITEDTYAGQYYDPLSLRPTMRKGDWNS